MPLTGAVDIALGLFVLLRPTRAALLYMAFWGLYTATLRPLTGEGGWELVERAYNFGGPLALLLLHGWGATRAQWLDRIRGTATVTRARAGVRTRLPRHDRRLPDRPRRAGAPHNKQRLIALYDSIGLTGLASDPPQRSDRLL